MSSIDLYDLTTTELFQKAQKAAQGSPFLNMNLDSPFTDINRNPITAPPELKNYQSALTLLKLEDENMDSDSKLRYFSSSRSLVGGVQEINKKKAVAETCDSILMKELNTIDNADLLLRWCAEGAAVKEEAKLEEMAGLQLGYINLTTILYKRATELSERSDGPGLLEVLSKLEAMVLIKLDVGTLVTVFGDLAINYVNQKNNLDGLADGPVNRDIQEAHRILSLLAKCRPEGTIKDEMDTAKRACDAIEKEVQPRASVVQPGQNEPKFTPDSPPDSNVFNIQITQIDASLIRKIDPPIYSMQTENFQICVYQAIYTVNNQQYPVAVKMYRARSASAKYDRIYKEIQIYQTLGAYSGPNYCFLPYYGTFFENYDINLVMEYQENNLMKSITHLKGINFNFQEQMIGPIVIKLIDSFALMRTLEIYHCDIKPHNILVDATWNLKIIDFSVSLVKTEAITDQITGKFPIQGTDGYRAPEDEEKGNLSKFRREFEKSDVFSLGLVILQMVLMTDLRGFNTRAKNRELMQFVNSVPWDWMKRLLSNMLSVDSANRSPFGELRRFLPEHVIKTQTAHNN